MAAPRGAAFFNAVGLQQGSEASLTSPGKTVDDASPLQIAGLPRAGRRSSRCPQAVHFILVSAAISSLPSAVVIVSRIWWPLLPAGSAAET
jgi:hypothetical protein